VDYDEWRDSAKSHGLNARRFKESMEALIKKNMVLENAEMYRTVPKCTEIGTISTEG